MEPAVERHRLQTEYPTIDLAPVSAVPSVLPSDQIHRLCQADVKMIDPWNPAMIRAASVRLRVGREYRKGDKIYQLDGTTTKNEITISPGEMIVIQTFETLNLPRDIIGRWNLKTDLVYKGLLWVGGPQVDPGWLGHLQCPIYNLSSEPVVLPYESPFAIMDFQRTTPFDPKLCIAYDRPPQKVAMDQYQYGDLATGEMGAVSALRRDLVKVGVAEQEFVTMVGDQVTGLRKQVAETKREQDRERDDLRRTSSNLSDEMSILRSSIFTVIAVFVAAVGALATAVAVFVTNGAPYVQPPWIPTLVAALLLGAFVLAAVALTLFRLLHGRVMYLEKRLNDQLDGGVPGPTDRA